MKSLGLAWVGVVALGCNSASVGASDGSTGTAGTGAPPDTCTQPADCPGGACWQKLDGARACVSPRATPTLSDCQFAPTPCCTKDVDCVDMTNGRCLPLFEVKENFCGGAVPTGNVCRYDQCATDADCAAGKPAGATVATCLPSGALGAYDTKCVYGACRTNADCKKKPGGQCQYGLAATNGACVLRNVFFCAYPSDACQGQNQGCAQGMICVPVADYNGRVCGPGPPMYP